MADVQSSAEPPVPLGSHERGREIDTLTEFDRVAAASRLAGYRIRSLDLTDRTFALLATDTADSVFLGCAMEPDAAVKVRAGGALVFPPAPGLPFDPYRGTLYTPDELFAGLLDAGYDATPDARTYRWYQETKATGDVVAGMLRSIHDDTVSDVLDEYLAGARVVGGPGWARHGARFRSLCGRSHAGAAAGPHGRDHRDRRRPRCDGGGEPRGVRRAVRGRHARRSAGPPLHDPALQALGHGMGERRVRSAPEPAGRRNVHRHAHLVLWARASERLCHPHRKVLRERAA
ncbi:hypothetical protein GCM10010341_05780 [Streptomyces noursei]|nr:hypothetical protein GCM10010341_05780 [Streptomyces noursei]